MIPVVLGRIANSGDPQEINALRAELGYFHLTIEVNLAVPKAPAVLMEPSDQEGIRQIISAMASIDTSDLKRLATAAALIGPILSFRSEPGTRPLFQLSMDHETRL